MLCQIYNVLFPEMKSSVWTENNYKQRLEKMQTVLVDKFSSLKHIIDNIFVCLLSDFIDYYSLISLFNQYCLERKECDEQPAFHSKQELQTFLIASQRDSFRLQVSFKEETLSRDLFRISLSRFKGIRRVDQMIEVDVGTTLEELIDWLIENKLALEDFPAFMLQESIGYCISNSTILHPLIERISGLKTNGLPCSFDRTSELFNSALCMFEQSFFPITITMRVVPEYVRERQLIISSEIERLDLKQMIGKKKTIHFYTFYLEERETIHYEELTQKRTVSEEKELFMLLFFFHMMINDNTLSDCIADLFTLFFSSKMELRTVPWWHKEIYDYFPVNDYSSEEKFPTLYTDGLKKSINMIGDIIVKHHVYDEVLLFFTDFCGKLLIY